MVAVARDLIIFDVRIAWSPDQQAGKTPPPPVVKLINPPLDTFQLKPTDDIAALFKNIGHDFAKGSVQSLTIYAHGYAERDVKGGIHGGYGLQLGQQDIVNGNAAQLFGELKGLFATPFGISLIGCEIAVQSAVKVGSKVVIGDGIALLQIVADAAGTGVKATRSQQEFEVTPGKGVNGMMVGGVRQRVEFETATVDPGPIEGLVISVSPHKKR